MFKTFASGLVALAISGLAMTAPVVAFAQDASLHEVYEAVDAGRFTEAQAMMDKVLKDHPNSAKAHFVEAQIQAKEGHYPDARNELNIASRLAPGLPFAKPQSVSELNGILNNAAQIPNQRSAVAPRYVPQYAPPQQQSGGFSMGFIVLIGIIVVVAFIIVRALRSRPIMNGGVAGPYGVNPGQPYGVGQPMQGGMPYGMGGGGGMGSGILGGLATGAAVGVGMMAGEELVRHMVDHNGNVQALPNQGGGGAPFDDVGGQDFGVSDAGSWDDNSSSGGDMGGGGGDWN